METLYNFPVMNILYRTQQVAVLAPLLEQAVSSTFVVGTIYLELTVGMPLLVRTMTHGLAVRTMYVGRPVFVPPLHGALYLALVEGGLDA